MYKKISIQNLILTIFIFVAKASHCMETASTLKVSLDTTEAQSEQTQTKLCKSHDIKSAKHVLQPTTCAQINRNASQCCQATLNILHCPCIVCVLPIFIANEVAKQLSR